MSTALETLTQQFQAVATRWNTVFDGRSSCYFDLTCRAEVSDQTGHNGTALRSFTLVISADPSDPTAAVEEDSVTFTCSASMIGPMAFELMGNQRERPQRALTADSARSVVAILEDFCAQALERS